MQLRRERSEIEVGTVSDEKSTAGVFTKIRAAAGSLGFKRLAVRKSLKPESKERGRSPGPGARTSERNSQGRFGLAEAEQVDRGLFSGVIRGGTTVHNTGQRHDTGQTKEGGAETSRRQDAKTSGVEGRNHTMETEHRITAKSEGWESF